MRHILFFVAFLFMLGATHAVSQDTPKSSEQDHSHHIKKFFEGLGISEEDVKKTIQAYGGSVIEFKYSDVPVEIKARENRAVSGSQWDITGRFPSDFLWGSAIAAHQVEGNNTNNDWWQFETYSDGPDEAISTKFPKFVRNSGRAAEHHSLFLESDLERARELGLNTFRMSLEWSRIEPSRGVYSAEATKYYRDYLIRLKEKGMRPMVTLWHFTLPQWVQKPGCYYDAFGQKHDEMDKSLKGWQNPEVVEAFAKFSAYCAENFGDLVDLWGTHNEPVTTLMIGYMAGFFPPGYILNWSGVKAAILNASRAHNKAYDMIKKHDKTDADGDGKASIVGIVPHFRRFILTHPNDQDDVEALRRLEYFYYYHMLDAAVHGKLDTNWDGVGDEVLQDGTCKLDFIGVNYYSTSMVSTKFVANLPFLLSKTFPELGYCPVNPDNDPARVPHNSLGWEIYPQGLYEVLMKLHARYRLPLYVTENGMADANPNTYKRSRYLVSHLQMMLKAYRDGADIRGYYVWTLTNNFEWREGFRKEANFGLYHVDVAGKDVSLPEHSLVRTPTPSVEAYSRMIEENGITPEILKKYGTFPDIRGEEK